MAKRAAAMAKREGRRLKERPQWLKERKQQWLSKMEKAEGTKKAAEAAFFSCVLQFQITIAKALLAHHNPGNRRLYSRVMHTLARM